MDRRSFLRGALALTAVAVVRPELSFAQIPTIYSNGTDDDTDGLQALLDGRPFRVEEVTVTAEEGEIDNGCFVVSKTLTLKRDGITIRNSKFILSDTWDYNEPCFHLTDYNTIQNCQFIGKGALRLWQHTR